MAETGPTITFQDNTATNERGVTLILIPGENGVRPRVTSPVMGDDYCPLRHSPDDEAGHNMFRDFARKVFALLDQCMIPQIHQTVYRAATLTPKSLKMDEWHTCDTVHCRGGWVTTLAREAGKELEYLFGTSSAAALIYEQNGYRIDAYHRFYRENEDQALEDMKRLAELEAVGLAPAEDELLNPNLDRR